LVTEEHFVNLAPLKDHATDLTIGIGHHFLFKNYYASIVEILILFNTLLDNNTVREPVGNEAQLDDQTTNISEGIGYHSIFYN
jgi:hypothetical protein